MVLGRGATTIGCHPGLWAVNVCFYLSFVSFTVVSLRTEQYEPYRVVVQYFIGVVYGAMAVVMLRLLMMVHFSLANPKVFTTAVRMQHPVCPTDADAASSLLNGAYCHCRGFAPVGRVTCSLCWCRV